MTENTVKSLNQMIRQDANGNWAVSLDQRFYDKSAVFAAAYKFNDQCRVHIEPDDEIRIAITFYINNGTVEGERLAKEFCQEVLDQQCRQDLQKQFGHLRDLIVEQAFKPVANLKDKIR